MTIGDILRGNLDRSLEVHRRLIDACLPALSTAAEALVAAYREGHKAIFFGNGGSAADAQHLAAEFVGRYLRLRHPRPALALNANSSAVTAIGNDLDMNLCSLASWRLSPPLATWPSQSAPREILLA